MEAVPFVPPLQDTLALATVEVIPPEEVMVTVWLLVHPFVSVIVQV
jgi:hypothetical protein